MSNYVEINFTVGSNSLVILVCTDAKTLIVYKDNAVVWNCKFSFSPIAIKTANLQVNKNIK